MAVEAEAPTASAAGKSKRLLPANIPSLRTLVRTLLKGGIEETGGDRMKGQRNKNRERKEGVAVVKASQSGLWRLLKVYVYLKSPDFNNALSVSRFEESGDSAEGGEVLFVN